MWKPITLLASGLYLWSKRLLSPAGQQTRGSSTVVTSHRNCRSMTNVKVGRNLFRNYLRACSALQIYELMLSRVLFRKMPTEFLVRPQTPSMGTASITCMLGLTYIPWYLVYSKHVCSSAALSPPRDVSKTNRIRIMY